jgi:hypothetical protein
MPSAQTVSSSLYSHGTLLLGHVDRSWTPSRTPELLEALDRLPHHGLLLDLSGISEAEDEALVAAAGLLEGAARRGDHLCLAGCSEGCYRALLRHGLWPQVQHVCCDPRPPAAGEPLPMSACLSVRSDPAELGRALEALTLLLEDCRLEGDAASPVLRLIGQILADACEDARRHLLIDLCAHADRITITVRGPACAEKIACRPSSEQLEVQVEVFPGSAERTVRVTIPLRT